MALILPLKSEDAELETVILIHPLAWVSVDTQFINELIVPWNETLQIILVFPEIFGNWNSNQVFEVFDTFKLVLSISLKEPTAIYLLSWLCVLVAASVIPYPDSVVGLFDNELKLWLWLAAAYDPAGW